MSKIYNFETIAILILEIKYYWIKVTSVKQMCIGMLESTKVSLIYFDTSL